MELLKEEEHVMVDIELDIPEEDYRGLLEYAKIVYTEEQHEKDMLNFVITKILREQIQKEENK